MSRSVSLATGISRVLSEYSTACESALKDHPLGAWIRQDVPNSVRLCCNSDLKVEGSPGKGNWAETPWVAIFDPVITTSAQRGVYLVYLFDRLGRHVYLSLNQATTEVRDEFGGDYQRVLLSRAEFARDLLLPYGIDDLEMSPLDLDGNGSLTRGYCAGNIVSIKYKSGEIPTQDLLQNDLNRMLSLYATYVAVRSGKVGEGEELPDDVKTAEDAQKYRWHRRAERNQKLVRDAKKIHGSTCMVCGFNFEDRYGERGSGYIEAHHIVPFAELAKEPEPVILDPRTDFVVVCANCHRMLHRSNPPLAPESLKLLLQ